MQSENQQKSTTASWQKIVKPYTEIDNKKSIFQLVNTLIPLVAMWYLTYRSLETSYFVTLGLGLITSFFFIRVFIIMHDLGHGTFFKTRKVRDIVGTLLGVLNLTPYAQWTKEHATHHSTSGNLDKRGHGDVWTVTVEEYQNMTFWEKFGYRVYRNPLITFLIGPMYIFEIRHRFSLSSDGPVERKGIKITNALIAVAILGMVGLVGLKSFLIVHMPILIFSQTLGCWLFYVQHQYEDVYWGKGAQWSYVDAALDGCSYYKLPKIIQWGTGNIGFHHIHHLSHQIPNYNLQRCYEENELFQNAKVLTFWSSLSCAFLKLYDEDTKELLTFREYAKRYKKAKKAVLAAA